MATTELQPDGTVAGGRDGELSPEAVIGRLEGHGVLRTPFSRTGPDGREYHVYLRCGDHTCSGDTCEHERCPDDDCTHLIQPDEFGEGAPMLLILGRQKLKYGKTYCDQCLPQVSR